MSRNSGTTSRRTGLLYVVSAPSGTGKTSLCKEILSIVPELRHSISYTTRPARPSEVSTRDYHFIDKHAFRTMIEEGAFLEWAEVYGHLYGTPRAPLKKWRDEGIDVLLDIDTQGASQIWRQELDAVSIYLLPPSLDVLKRRLENRQSDSPEEIARRFNKAREEIYNYRDYTYVIINDDFKSAVKQLEAIILAERSRTTLMDLSAFEHELLSNKEKQ